MSSELQRNLPLLEILRNCNPKLRKAIIAHANPELINTICEICLNFLNGNVECTKHQHKELKQHKGCMQKLVKRCKNVKTPRSKKLERQILLQKGEGFWFSLLTPVVTELSSFIISKALQR